MTDCHIHLERGPYTIEWLNQFVETAIHRGLDEIYLLEHSFRFKEFIPMYESVCSYSDYQQEWFRRKNDGSLSLQRYIAFIEEAKEQKFPIRVKYGLEVCYFKEHEQLIRDVAGSYPFDFLTGSVHWVDGFGFDNKKELWAGIDVNHTYRRYYEIMQKLIESDLFTGVAHPDSIKVYGHKPSYDLNDTYKTLADLLGKHQMYAEQSGGLHLNYSPDCALGMNSLMLKVFIAGGVRLMTASDAHIPTDVGAHIAELHHLIENASKDAAISKL